MSTQSKIIEAFSLGKFSKCDVEKPKHIITSISNVFVCGEKVYKIYKNDNEAFNRSFYDLSNKQKRFGFTRDDFSWNQSLNKEIYLELRGAVLKEGGVIFIDPTDNAEELCIVMKKVDMHNGLFVQLMDGRLTMGDFYKIGYQLAETISVLPEIPDRGLTLYEDFVVRIKDVDEWLGIFAAHISRDEAKKYIHFMNAFIEKHKSELEERRHPFGTNLDMHSENALYKNGKLLLIDTYPPKADWKRGYKYMDVYRFTTDIYALRGEREFREALKGYTDFSKEILESKYEELLVIYAATIMCPHLYMLGERDPLRAEAAKKYHDFLRGYLKNR